MENLYVDTGAGEVNGYSLAFNTRSQKLELLAVAGQTKDTTGKRCSSARPHLLLCTLALHFFSQLTAKR